MIPVPLETDEADEHPEEDTLEKESSTEDVGNCLVCEQDLQRQLRCCKCLLRECVSGA